MFFSNNTEKPIPGCSPGQYGDYNVGAPWTFISEGVELPIWTIRNYEKFNQISTWFLSHIHTYAPSNVKYNCINTQSKPRSNKNKESLLHARSTGIRSNPLCIHKILIHISVLDNLFMIPQRKKQYLAPGKQW